MVTHLRYRDKVSNMIGWGHWFALFNILLSLVLSSSYLFIFDWPDTLTGRIYAFVSWLGHFSFVVFATYLLIIFPLTFIVMSQRLLRLLCVALATAGITLLIFDIRVFSQFGLHLTPQVWDLVINPTKGEMAREWQLMFISIPIIFLVEMLFATWSWQKLRSLNRQTFGKPLAAIFIVTFIMSHLMYAWADANFYRPITMQRYNYPLSQPMTARKLLDRYGLLDLTEHQNRVFQQGSPTALKLNYPLKPLSYYDQGADYNLLLLVIDDLGDKSQQDSMRALNEFKEISTQFTNHYTAGLRNDTALFGLFYGISSTYFDNILNGRHPSALIEALQHQGYQFGLFSTDGFNSPLFRQAILADYSLPAKTADNDNLTVTQWNNWLDNLKNGSPWFSFLNIKGTPGSAKTNEQINRVMAALQRDNRLQNTIVIVTANYNNQGKAENEWLDGKRFNRDNMQVPLFIYWPNTPAQQIDKLTSHQDVMTTLMQRLLHVSNPPDDYSQGEDLFSVKRTYPWVITGDNDDVVITTDNATLYMDQNGQFNIYDKQGAIERNEKPDLAELLKIFTELKRFNEN
ncbi:LPS biosynthesis-modulating metalloenzyme YejM [Providencia rettgeri]|uniref:LPS biosynthesis-modulating metalloenzyme YejM n=1 Tax=Providencia TaxID=586 RepID=UPI001B363119|nr:MULTISPECIES: LPS biosynthesis-modulating metalloenzyme YejM [Providencia]MBQ0531720.1 LPS biosynthesis-modulating metalloenzyme YejM [Providencia rettgeri]WOB88097.1 LPS biosynthesis-modulating metalloenzyme YejM [Providencia sp. PROV040]